MSRVLACLLVGAALSASADCNVPLWRVGSTVAHSAKFLTAADLDGGDGPDIVGNDATSIFIALNDGTGAFPAAGDGVYSGTIRGGVAVADATGDAKPDLVFASSDSLIVVPGNGNGTFGVAVVTAVTIVPEGVVPAMLDAGNALDLVTFDPALAVAVVYTGNGTGGFTEAVRLPLRPQAKTVEVADLDADGWMDVVAGYGNVATFDVFYGTGNATFAPVSIVSGVVSMMMRAADMDGNHLPELAAGQSGAVTMFRNLGGRRFGDPLIYRTQTYNTEVLTGDLTGDSVPDVVVPGPGCGFSTLTGTGIGTLQYLFRHYENLCGNFGEDDLAMADVDRDGREDVIVAAYSGTEMARVAVYRNACGDVDVNGTPLSPVISAGQSATLKFKLVPPYTWSNFWIPPTGTVTLRRGDAVIDSITTNSAAASFTVPGLPLGEHSFTADYGGDQQYEPKTSAPVTVRVVNDTTTTALTLTPAQVVYGAVPSISVTVTSSTGSTPTGPVRVSFDGGFDYTLYPPSLTMQGPYQLGTHTAAAKYDGDAQHPPSSATLSYTVVKQTPALDVTPAYAPVGQAQTVQVGVSNIYPNYGPARPSGSVTFRLDNGSPQTKPVPQLYPYTAAFDVPALALGRHSLRISYSGDANYNAAESIITYLVYDPAALTIDARGTSGGVTVIWFAPDTRRLQRRLPSGAWDASWPCCGSPWFDHSTVPDTVYLYRTIPYYGDGAASLPDVAMQVSFTDDPLIGGTKIRGVHMQEIVRAANILRAAAGLPPLATTGLTSAHSVTAERINDLRAAINEARAAFGAPAWPFTGTIAKGTTIRASHLQELREAIR